jgi:serine-type D-Ala-D-Ala carboxypeptidase/endopeptidase (penicillin-binding protein 4)
MRFFVLLLLAGVIPAQTISARIDKILAASPAARQAFWGIKVVDLRTGATVYARNENSFFVPASNTKLFSTALALSRLGPDHRFYTRITAPELPDASGRVSEVRFAGGGDPNLSGRVLPYQYDSTPADQFRYVDDFARQLAAMGLTQVDGDVVADVSRYASEPFPEGWAIDDPVYAYGAPIGPLLLNDGMFRLKVSPTLPGLPAAIEFSPAVDQLIIHNLAITGEDTDLQYRRLPGSFELTISGTVSRPQEEFLGMQDPASFAAQALRAALMRVGIRVSGGARVERFPAPGRALITHRSLPLIEALRVINKESQNLHAEIMLLEVARVRHGSGSREIGLEDLKNFLRGIGIEDKQYHFEDGSGLSRTNLVTPATIIKLLQYMHGSEHGELWISTLAVGGEDGTLAKRFSGSQAANLIVAKTGSISHVNALSGYARGRYAFSILVNNSNHPAAPVRRVIDQVALAIAR